MLDRISTRGKSYLDPALNAFTKTNIAYTNNKLLKFQDPTLLGFKLFFLFDSPDSGLLCSNEDTPNTAMYYLKKRGDEVRMGYLKSFIKLLKGINSECPWFWQSIEGLDEAWKHGFNEAEFKAGISADRKITINTLDESVDLRMTALMDLYRKACFDWVHRREIVPRNLRWFNVSIYVYDGRIFNRDGKPYQGSLLPKATDVVPYPNQMQNENLVELLLGVDPLKYDTNTTKDYINVDINRVMFDFTMCEWLPDESNTTVASVSHKEMGLKAQKIVFNYRNVAESNIYRMFHDKAVSDSFVSSMDALALDIPVAQPGGTTIQENGGALNKPSLLQGLFGALLEQKLAKLDMIKNQYTARNGPDYGNNYGILDPYKNLPKVARDAALRAQNELLRAAAKLRQLFLGNVFGFSAASAAELLEAGPGGVVSGIAREVGKNASKTNVEGLPNGTINMGGGSMTNQPGMPNGTINMGGGSMTNQPGMPNGTINMGGGSMTNQPGNPTPEPYSGISLINQPGNPSGTINMGGGSMNNQSGNPVPEPYSGTSLINQPGSPSGTINMAGGSMNNQPGNPSGTINMAGGSMNNQPGNPNGTINMAGGSMTNQPGNPSGTINMAGGSMTNQPGNPNGTINMAGGSMTNQPGNPSGTINMAGGSMTNQPGNPSGTVDMNGGSMMNQPGIPKPEKMTGDSLKNDNGPDAKPQGRPNGNASLNNG